MPRLPVWHPATGLIAARHVGQSGNPAAELIAARHVGQSGIQQLN
ncbi:hypothetical protein [Pantoea rwandensis]|nr:hypothetical protein [Pantoea rwandensis]